MAVQFGTAPPKTTSPAPTNAGFDVVKDIEVAQFKTESGSVIVKFTTCAVSSFVDCGPIADIVGASLVAVTVRVNVSESVKTGIPESATVNVKSTVPF